MALAPDLTPRLTTRLLDYWLTVFKRTWRGSAVTSFLMPVLYLTAMGVGLGSFVDKSSGPGSLDGASYLAFIAPGLLATTAMMTAVGESTYPVYGGFKWHKSYYSMAATPLKVADIVAAQLGFIAFRIFVTCAVFLGVIAAFGVLYSWWGGLLAVLVMVLLGLAHAAPIAGIAARMRSESGFALIFRLGLMPMFLFSGAFFPVTQLPDAITWLCYLTPIWHGVDLTRMLTLGTVSAWPALGHIAYLLAWLAAGWWYVITGFGRRLEQ
ncbi:MAG: ABC transporter permease [Nocardioidaceae bacterium]